MLALAATSNVAHALLHFLRPGSRSQPAVLGHDEVHLAPQLPAEIRPGGLNHVMLVRRLVAPLWQAGLGRKKAPSKVWQRQYQNLGMHRPSQGIAAGEFCSQRSRFQEGVILVGDRLSLSVAEEQLPRESDDLKNI